MNKYWFFVGMTCLLELAWVFGFTTADKWWHWGLVGIVIVVDFLFFSKACEGLPTGTVYAMFAAVGSIGTVLMDVYLFGGSIDFAKLFFIGLLIVGVISLKIADQQIEDGEKS
ncbi:DMT family transporter [Alkalibacillus aidingensis]|uniref:DMT family transporter n=1 Tax=Alkalibacillus aidingensis TaxID=2747607 RepID=UPI001660D61B|nr:SMR family transporter [Alkalibacillus aidingensis]